MRHVFCPPPTLLPYPAPLQTFHKVDTDYENGRRSSQTAASMKKNKLGSENFAKSFWPMIIHALIPCGVTCGDDIHVKHFGVCRRDGEVWGARNHIECRLDTTVQYRIIHEFRVMLTLLAPPLKTVLAIPLQTALIGCA